MSLASLALTDFECSVFTQADWVLHAAAEPSENGRTNAFSAGVERESIVVRDPPRRTRRYTEKGAERPSGALRSGLNARRTTHDC